jgi:hypothetical protein
MTVRLQKSSAITLTMKATMCLTLVGFASASLLVRNGDDIQNTVSHDNVNENGESLASEGMFRTVSQVGGAERKRKGMGNFRRFVLAHETNILFRILSNRINLPCYQLLLQWPGYDLALVNNEGEEYEGDEFEGEEYDDDDDGDEEEEYDDGDDEEENDEMDTASSDEDASTDNDNNKIILTDFFLKEDNRELRARRKNNAAGRIGPKKGKAENSSDLRGCLKGALESVASQPVPKAAFEKSHVDGKKMRKKKNEPKRQLFDESKFDEATSASEMDEFIHGYVNGQERYDNYYNYGEYQEYYEFSRGLQQCDDITPDTQNLVSKKHFHNDAKIPALPSKLRTIVFSILSLVRPDLIARNECIASSFWLQPANKPLTFSVAFSSPF